MVLVNRTSLLIYLVVFALIVGCSGGNGQDPVTADVENGLTDNIIHQASGNSLVWEMGEVYLNTEELEVEVVPLRTLDFTCNIVKFLQPPAGNTANLAVSFDLAGSDFPNAFVDLDCTLTHPFPGTKYWGFDTRVIVFGGGSTVGQHDSTVQYPAPTELRMTNADGYTRWFNRTEFGPFGEIFGYTKGVMAPNFTTNFGIVNGFKYFCEGISETATPPYPDEGSRGVFSDGAVTREMKLQFPQVAQPFKFVYSVAASWDEPSSTPPTDVSQFPDTANAQEAYQIVVRQDPASDAFYDETGGPSWGGDLILDIEVWDWQAAGDPASEISEIWVESPTLLSTQGDAVEITGTWTQSAGSSANSVVYEGTLANLTPDAVENQELLITVVSAGATTYEPPLPGKLYPDEPLAAYQLYTATILDSGDPPDKTITVDIPNGGETLVIGEPYTITWSSTGAITDVVIEYSIDSGSTYPYTIAPTTSNTGSFEWAEVDDTPSTTCRVRITEDGGTVSDESDDDFTISDTAEAGWNPIPGQQQIALDPAPNQSTVTPDLGIQNDDAGNEGAWIVDQEGGTADGSPIFYDYLLDWSGPGGEAYPSGFNYLVAPFARHDASANGITMFGCFGNTEQWDPPTINDPFTTFWYISWIEGDEGVDPGLLDYVFWGDTGSGDPGDPPEDDPNERPWFHTCDVSSGLPGWQGDPMDFASIWLMCYSQDEDDPYVMPDEESGNLNVGFWMYPYLQTLMDGRIYRLGFPEWTTDNTPLPFDNAFDVEDPTKCRIAADTDSYITFYTDTPYLATLVYMLDSLGNWYGTGFEMRWDDDPLQYGYFPLSASLKIRTDDTEMYIDGATAVDLEVLPTMTVLYEGDYETDFGNWCAVLFDTGTGYQVRVYDIDWTAEAGEEITIIDTTDELPGTPLSLDVDPWNFTIHVIADNGGTVEATVFDYSE